MKSRIFENKPICKVRNTGNSRMLENYPAYELYSQDKLMTKQPSRGKKTKLRAGLRKRRVGIN